MNEDSILAVQVFDQKKFKKKDQGFLGVINVRVGDVCDLNPGGADGQFMSFLVQVLKLHKPTKLVYRNAHKRSQEIKR